MRTQYKRITDEERDVIAIRLAEGITQAGVARELNRRPSTISREVSRNGYKAGGYGAAYAGRLAYRQRRSCRQGKHKLGSNGRLRQYVLIKLSRLWSPAQIVSRMREEYPQDTDMRISEEAIYQYLYVQPSKDLRRLLRYGHLQRHRRGRPKKTANVGKIPDMTMIDERPEEVVSRLVPGHWEGDIIKGKRNQSALGTLVERRTRYTVLVPLPATDANSVRKAFAKALLEIPEDIRKTMTYDQGKEMSDHIQLMLDTNMQVYFAHEKSPWERGTNENTNGLIRQFFPKSTDFHSVPKRKIKRAQSLLNDRPRQVLGFKKPDEVLSMVLR